jgi:hypothetical protein
MIAQSDSRVGAQHAYDIVSFESAHGFWVEPGWQLFFEHTHHVLGTPISWDQVVPVANGIYLFGHVLITLFFALWMFVYRRGVFAFVRNIFFATNALALVLYEAYPLAPPRLTTGLGYDGHPYHFVDTMWQVLGANGKVVGTQIGYNEYAAMPSLHVGWALIVALGLAWTLRSLVPRLLILLYPPIMLVMVVITGNHYIMDAVGAAGILVLATVLALLYAWWRAGWGSFQALVRDLNDRRFVPFAGATGSSPDPNRQAVA